MISRETAVAIARGWLGTPYVLRGRIRGAGVDCGTLLAEYLVEIGAATCAELEDLGFYAHDWFCHDPDERYLVGLGRHARRVLHAVCRPAIAEARPGSLALFRTMGSPRFNHGAIVTTWPLGIHACLDRVQESDLTAHHLTAFRHMELFEPNGLAA